MTSRYCQPAGYARFHGIPGGGGQVCGYSIRGVPVQNVFYPGVESRGQEVSQYNIKKLIEQMVRSEDPGNPLTDSQIAHALTGGE